MIKLLLVDDHPVVRDGLKRLLGDYFHPILADEARSGQEAINKLWKNEYDLVLLDISLPGRDGLDVLKQIKSLKPDLPILVLSILPEELFGLRVLKAGASGYLSKTKPAEELIEAVKKVLSGKRYISLSLAEKLAFSFENDTAPPAHKKLSDREFQVTRMIASGKTVKKIAEEMCLSKKTIFKTRLSIKKKMEMKNNREIICYAVSQGLVE